MPGKITFEITKGELAGQKFEYEEADRVFVGRQEDCGIVLPENTVSRYHCLLDINPPTVKLQDFGSLNGTYLNGEKIGQRERGQSWEEAKSEQHEEYELHDGDVIRLGKRCEFRCGIEQPKVLTISEAMDSTLPEEPEDENATLPEEAEETPPPAPEPEKETKEIEKPAPKANPPKQEPPEAEKPKQEQAKTEKPKQDSPKPQAPKQETRKPVQKTCKGCGKRFTPKAPDDNLCDSCRADREKVLGDILAMLIGGAQPEQPTGPSPVAGYDKVALLGKGGMGEVWKVKERKTGKILALKTMLPQVAADEKAKRMFLREAKLSEFLRHKNVVRTYQTGSSDGVFYILMDLCEGGSVDDLMKKHGGKLPLDLATYIMLQVLSGLDYVHNADVEAEIKKRGLFGGAKIVSAKGVVHRDFKPGNIFLSDKSDHPVAMVADFGMAKAFETAGLTDMSAPGAVKGTVPFMPRQQALDCRFAKPEIDVWAAAASYYHMLTGQFPKNFKPGGNIWQAIVTEAAVPIRKRDAAIPEKLAQVIDRALIERPEIGCKSAAVLRRDLIAALPRETRDYCKDLLK